MTKFISASYDVLEETFTNFKSIKIKSYPGDNVMDLCVEIVVDVESLESAGGFNPAQLGYITRIFEDTSDSRFRLWGYQYGPAWGAL